MTVNEDAEICCSSCSREFASHRLLKIHNANYHASLELIINDDSETSFNIDRFEGDLTCPFCDVKFKQKSSLWRHFRSGACKSNLKNDFSLVQRDILKENDSEESPENDEIVGTPEPTRCDYDAALLHACQENPCSPQKRALTILVLYDVGPLSLTNAKGEETNLIISPKLIDELIATLHHSPFTLTVPAKCVCISPPILRHDISLEEIASTGIIQNFLRHFGYIELTKDMCMYLNIDWMLAPQQRYLAAKALCGLILVDPVYNQGLLVNSVEMYGRDRDIDAHCEPQSTTSYGRHMSSYPPHGTKYTGFWVTDLTQPEGGKMATKLVIGTNEFNALVTSSMRIDKVCNPECGPSTLNFVLNRQSSLDCKIYMNKTSWATALALANDPNGKAIERNGRLAQSRQLRTKFHMPSTHKVSHVTLMNGPLQQPFSIYTYRAFGDGRKADGKVASSFFMTTALKVIGGDDSALALTRKKVLKCHDDSVVFT